MNGTQFIVQIILLVLIDTWWNVNLHKRWVRTIIRRRFNRYMVECEFNFYNCFVCTIYVLIDTWWNVN